MNSGDSAGLGGPLKKPAAKPGAAKPLGGGLGGSAGKPLSNEAPSAPAAPPAPSAPLSFEFDDAPAPEKKKPADKPAAPSFNPFDQPVAVPAANVASALAPTAPGTGRVEKPGTARIDKPGTGRVEKPATARVEKPGTGKSSKPPAVDPADADIAPGMGKDLWLCPHCGAKNKPTRETCRECKKSPADEVEKPWFMQPKIIGPVAGGVVLLIVLIMWMTNVDLTLHPAGTVDNKVRSASAPPQDLDLGETRTFTIKRTAAVSGRIITTTEYPAAPWLIAVVLGLGSSAKDDATFSNWSAEFDGSGYSVKAPQYATLFLLFDSNKPKLKAGDYISVVGKAGVPEQDHTIVKGTDNPNCFSIKVEQFDKN
ncbi:MAG TPA: zinc finger Ran-binding domain-containing protein [Planctomycetota bacterium]|nr:zinc finger Ran-binding domain-containing protein [Planctomycetota bacterium]